MIAEEILRTILIPASVELRMDSNEITQKLWEEIATVEDPELHMSIRDLGLIYEVLAENGIAHVKMTLTSMGCPAGPELTAGVQAACTRVEGIESAEVEVVWTPKWDPKEMASEEARMMLGIY